MAFQVGAYAHGLNKVQQVESWIIHHKNIVGNMGDFSINLRLNCCRFNYYTLGYI